MPVDHAPSDRDTPESAPFGRFRRAAELEAVRPPPSPPWTLISLAALCIMAIIAGGFGPWFRIETPQPHTVSGTQTDGLIAIVAAAIAAVALLFALIRPSARPAAWFSVLGIAISALTGLATWLELAPPPSGTGADTRWGVPVVTLAGAAGTLCTLLIARRLNRY